MKKYVLFLFLVFLPTFMSGCIFDKKPLPDSGLDIQVLPPAPQDANLGILVSYLDNTTYQGKIIPRIKIVTENEFDTHTGYKFLGRAYSKDYPGRNGFGLPVYEYLVLKYNPSYVTSGFKYSLGMECQPVPYVVECPNKEIVAHVYSLENYTQGIIALYQYETPVNVAFTTDTQEIMGMQSIYGNIPVTIVGYVYHSTQSDRDKHRSN